MRRGEQEGVRRGLRSIFQRPRVRPPSAVPGNMVFAGQYGPHFILLLLPPMEDKHFLLTLFSFPYSFLK